MLAKKQSVFEQIERIKMEIITVKNNVRNLSGQLGPKTFQRLKHMAKSSSANVEIDAINFKDYIDEYGKPKKEKSLTTNRIGVIKGLTIFNDYTFESLNSEIHNIKRAYDLAELVSDDAKTAHIESLTNSMGDFNHLISHLKQLKQDEQAFFDNNFQILCFLVSDKPDRYKTAQFVLKQLNKPNGKDKAKIWLSEKENEIKATLKADKLAINY